MAITKLAAVLNGLVKNTDLTTQEIVVDSVKVGGSSGTALTKTVLDGLVSNSHASGSDNQTITAGNGLSGGGSGSSVTLDVSVDGSSIEISSDSLRVKALGITDAMLAGNISAGKLAQTYIQTSEKGANSGVATLDSGGKVPVAQLPNSVMEYKGTWAASTNTPTLTDGIGNAGDVYIASDAGTVNFGSGNITFAAGDWVMYSGSVWQKSINSNAVASVNSQTGAVVLDTDDISEGSTNKYFSDSLAQTAVVASSITDGDTTHSPSGNAVYDALALKADDSSVVKSVNSVLPVSGDVSIDTDDVSEGATNKYYSSTLFTNDFSSKTTDQLTEGSSNKYYSSGLFNTDFSSKDTDDLSEGTTNKYYSSSLFNTDFASKDTDDLAEGTTNLFMDSTEQAKLSNISITQAVDLDALETASHSHSNKSTLDNITAAFTTADETKLDFITVTQAVDLDDMESDIAALQAGSSIVKKSLVAGETFAANTTFLVRFAISGETAGRVYKATSAAYTDGKYWVVGLVMNSVEKAAGDSMDVILLGSSALGSSDTAFDSADVGKPVWLTTAGGFSITAPSADNTACFKVGYVQATSSIFVDGKQLTAVN